MGPVLPSQDKPAFLATLVQRRGVCLHVCVSVCKDYEGNGSRVEKGSQIKNGIQKAKAVADLIKKFFWLREDERAAIHN